VQTSENQAEEQVTLQEAEVELRLSRSSLYRAVAEGMPCERWGTRRLIRLRLSECRAWLAARGQQSADAVLTGGAR
jgi:hypothetical protein